MLFLQKKIRSLDTLSLIHELNSKPWSSRHLYNLYLSEKISKVKRQILFGPCPLGYGLVAYILNLYFWHLKPLSNNITMQVHTVVQGICFKLRLSEFCSAINDFCVVINLKM